LEFVPCCISSTGYAEKLEYHGSAHLAALMDADGFFIVSPGIQSIPAQAEVQMMTFRERCP
jgi:molybdopterin biosynthesis enzyme